MLLVRFLAFDSTAPITGLQQVARTIQTAIYVCVAIMWLTLRGVPSISADDPMFLVAGGTSGIYWRGQTWAPQAYLVYQALGRYDHIPVRPFACDSSCRGGVGTCTEPHLACGTKSGRCNFYKSLAGCPSSQVRARGAAA